LEDKKKIEKLKCFESLRYKKIDLDRLIMYVIGELEKINVDLSFENVTVAAFKIFPEKFSLLGYPEYPDSNRVHNCLWRCSDKPKQWLGGKLRQGFIINEKSRIIIGEAEKMLNGFSIKGSKASSKTRRKEMLLSEVLSSSAYKKYLDGKKSAIKKQDICFLLQGTLDSSQELLKGNLKIYIKYADELENNDAKEFLLWVEKNIDSLFKFKE